MIFVTVCAVSVVVVTNGGRVKGESKIEQEPILTNFFSFCYYVLPIQNATNFVDLITNTEFK